MSTLSQLIRYIVSFAIINSIILTNFPIFTHASLSIPKNNETSSSRKTKRSFFEASCIPLRPDYTETDYNGWKKYSNESIETIKFLRDIYKECGTKKTCLSFPPDDELCFAGGTCSVGLTFGNLGFVSIDKIIVEVVALSSKWVAVVFSKNKNNKENAYRVECVDEFDTVKIWETSYDDKGNPEPRFDKTLFTPIATRVETKSIGRALVYCKFYLKIAFTNNRSNVSYDFANTLFHTSILRGTGAIHHDTGSINEDPICTKNTSLESKEGIDLTFQMSPNAKEIKLIFAHSICMLIGFLCFGYIGGFYTRYFKLSFNKIRLFLGIPLFLWIHMICEGGLVLLMMNGLLLTGIMREGKYHKNPHHWSLHGVLGIFICTIHLAFFFFYTIFRTKVTKQWTFRLLVHQFIGHLSSLCFLFLVNNLHHLPFSGMSCLSVLLVRLWTIFFFFMHLVMSLYYAWIEYLASYYNIRIVLPNPLTPVDMFLQPNFESSRQPLDNVKFTLFGVFAFVTILTCGGIILSLDKTEIESCRTKWYRLLI